MTWHHLGWLVVADRLPAGDGRVLTRVAVGLPGSGPSARATALRDEDGSLRFTRHARFGPHGHPALEVAREWLRALLCPGVDEPEVRRRARAP